jgi:hypothetical protein
MSKDSYFLCHKFASRHFVLFRRGSSKPGVGSLQVSKTRVAFVTELGPVHQTDNLELREKFTFRLTGPPPLTQDST